MSTMNISRLLQTFLLVMISTKFLASAMVCDKLINTGAAGNAGISNEILETGRYEVRTTARTNSTEVQSLIDELDGASDIQYSIAWFTAILQPKDLKKVSIAIYLDASVASVLHRCNACDLPEHSIVISRHLQLWPTYGLLLLCCYITICS